MTEVETGFEPTLENQDFSLQQQALYESFGITPASVSAELLDSEKRKQGWKTALSRWHELSKNEQEEAVRDVNKFILYLNCSDSLPNLYSSLNLHGKKVLTVAGSGEFPQVMIDRGAEAIDITDYSLAACFFSELKLIAARHLSLEKYRKMFGTINPDLARSDRFGEAEYSIFDADLYEEVKGFLSPNARIYFDQIQQPGFEKYYKFQATAWKEDQGIQFSPLSHNEDIRYRSKNLGSDQGFGEELPFLRKPERFKQFQNRLAKARYRIIPGDVSGQNQALRDYGYIYLSNVGYYGEDTLRIIKDLLDQGARKIGFTCRPGEMEAQLISSWNTETQIEGNDHIYVDKDTKEAFLPGMTIRFKELDMFVRVVAYDPTVDFGYYCEVEGMGSENR